MGEVEGEDGGGGVAFVIESGMSGDVCGVRLWGFRTI